MDNTEENPILMKLVLIGPTKCGKSSILSRYVRNEFSEEISSTIGLDFSIKMITVNGKQVKLQIFDTSGQERFRSMASTFFIVSSAVIVVLDRSSNESLAACESFYNQAKENASEKTVFMVLGNKSDLGCVVSTEQGHEFALRCGAIYLEGSAKNNDNIGSAFEIVAAEVLRNIKNS